MTDRENFLERWSRRKVEAEQEAGHAEKAPERPDAPSDSPASKPSVAATGAIPPRPASPKAEFDIASLPSLDTITQATDIRAFLKPGVPADLTRAALRRAWAADPAIRDFVGLQEYDWDFANPNGIPGFGDIASDVDIKKLVAQIFGEPDETSEAAAKIEPPSSPKATQPSQIADGSEPSVISNAVPADREVNTGEPQVPASSTGDFTTVAEVESGLVQRNNNIATHNSILETPPAEPKTSRKHGRALPK